MQNRALTLYKIREEGDATHISQKRGAGFRVDRRCDAVNVSPPYRRGGGEAGWPTAPQWEVFSLTGQLIIPGAMFHGRVVLWNRANWWSLSRHAAQVIGHRLGGESPWLFLIAPPSGVKTELLRMLWNATDVFPFSDLTARTFASGLDTPNPGAVTGHPRRLQIRTGIPPRT